MTNAEVSLEGEVQRVTFENPQTGFRVIKITVAGRDGWLSVIGAFPQVGVGSRVRVRGTMERDREYGEQIRASSVTELRPSTLDGIVKYLGSGAIKGVGERYAGRIVERFGLETLRVLDEEPDRLSEVEGLGPKRVEAIRTAWREQQGLREVMVFLQSHGASAALAARIHKRYGDRALAIVSSDPYRLAVDVWGIGFRTADRIASSLGVAKDSDARVQAGVLQVLRDLSDAGHTWAPASAIEEHASRLLGDEQGPAALGDRVGDDEDDALNTHEVAVAGAPAVRRRHGRIVNIGDVGELIAGAVGRRTRMEPEPLLAVEVTGERAIAAVQGPQRGIPRSDVAASVAIGERERQSLRRRRLYRGNACGRERQPPFRSSRDGRRGARNRNGAPAGGRCRARKFPTGKRARSDRRRRAPATAPATPPRNRRSAWCRRAVRP